MHFIALSLLLAASALAAPSDEAATCAARHAELAKQAATERVNDFDTAGFGI